MKKELIAALAVSLGLTGCATTYPLGPGSQVGGSAVMEMCDFGVQRYNALQNPNALERAAKKTLDVACKNPQATYDLIASAYQVLKAQ